jgi:MscS family membrane protein
MYASLGGREKTDDTQLHGLGTPRQALLTFLMAIDRDDDVDAARCLDLSEYPTSARIDIGPVLAFKIKYILDRTIRLFLAEIPTDPDGPPVVLYRGPEGRIVMAQRHDGEQKVWGFTALTVRDAEKMFTKLLHEPPVPDLPSLARSHPSVWMEPGVWVRAHLPESLRQQHVGLDDYQWPGLVVLLAVAWGGSVLVRQAVYVTLCWAAGIGHAEAEGHLVRTKLRSLQTLAFVLLSYYLLEWLDLPVGLAARIYVVQKLLLAFVLTWAGLQWADLARLAYEQTERWQQHRGLGDLILPFTLTVVKVAVVLSAAGFLLFEFGKAEALTRFFAGVGIVGLAASLAAQDSLKNLFGTLLLIGDRSFRIGDRLIINGQEGIVEQVGFRSTKLRTLEDSLLVLPNGLLANGVIDNQGMHALRRVRLVFTMAMATPIEKALALREAVQDYLHNHPLAYRKRAYARLQKIGELGIELEVSAYFDTREAEMDKELREQIICEVLRLGRSSDVELRGTKG